MPGRYVVFASGLLGEQYVVRSHDVEVPSKEPLRIVVGAHVIRGRIVGGLRAGYRVTLLAVPVGIVAAVTWADLDGNFTLEGVGTGRYVLEACAGGRASHSWKGNVDRDLDVFIQIKK